MPIDQLPPRDFYADRWIQSTTLRLTTTNTRVEGSASRLGATRSPREPSTSRVFDWRGIYFKQWRSAEAAGPTQVIPGLQSLHFETVFQQA